MSLATLSTIKEILDAPLRIPEYQRPYTWTSQNVQQLLDDIDNAQSKEYKEYHIGALILHRYKDLKSDIVDGQQRITTILLILKFLGEASPLLSSLQYNHDLSIYNIKNNYDVIKQHFTNYSKLNKFKEYLLNKCYVVRVEIIDVSEAFQLFDSQNHRGKGLAPHDLLKAFHIRAMRNDPPQLKVDTDLKWQEHKNLEEIFQHKLYRIRKWAKKHPDLHFHKKKIGEFKGFDLTKQEYPYQNILAHLNSHPKHTPTTIQCLRDMLLNSYMQVNQKIINGNHFFNYVDTYSRLHKALFENLLDDDKGIENNLTKFRSFYRDNSRHDKYHYRHGDIYTRLLYEASILAFVDKYGERELRAEIYEGIYRAVYHIRVSQKRVDEVSILKSDFAQGFFNMLEYSYEPNEVRIFLNDFNKTLNMEEVTSPKLSETMKKFFEGKNNA